MNIYHFVPMRSGRLLIASWTQISSPSAAPCLWTTVEMERTALPMAIGYSLHMANRDTHTLLPSAPNEQWFGQSLLFGQEWWKLSGDGLRRKGRSSSIRWVTGWPQSTKTDHHLQWIPFITQPLHSWSFHRIILQVQGYVVDDDALHEEGVLPIDM